MSSEYNADINTVNFSVSGWSGSGATSLALILAKLFNYNNLYLGSVFRYVGKKLGYSEEGFNRPKSDDLIEPIIGPTADRYRDYKLIEGERIIVDSDIGTFLIGKHPKIFSIFLKSDFEERLKKVVKDEREGALEVLKHRDEINQKFFMELHNIDVFDEELIDRKFNFVIDNTHVSLEAEVKMVIEELRNIPHFKTSFDLDEVSTHVDEEVRDFALIGKDAYKEKLLQSKIIIPPEEILTDITKIFPEDIAEFPEKIQKIFLGID